MCMFNQRSFLIACVLSCFSHVWLSAPHHAPLPMGFFQQEYWSGLLCSPPGDLPNPGIQPRSPESPALQGRFLTAETPGNPIFLITWARKHDSFQPLQMKPRAEGKGLCAEFAGVACGWGRAAAAGPWIPLALTGRGGCGGLNSRPAVGVRECSSRGCRHEEA